MEFFKRDDGTSPNIHEIRAMFPQEGIPNYPASLDHLGIQVVQDSIIPAHQPTEKPVRGAPVEGEDGLWHWTWTLEQLEGAELALALAAENTELASLKPKLVESVDVTIAAIYNRWLRFEAEYVEREAAAHAFVEAGYEGSPGVWVSAFADAAGMEYSLAADRIIAQAIQLRGALQALGALRMTKYSILSATSPQAAHAAYNSIIAQAKQIASAL